MQRLHRMVGLVAQAPMCVLVVGETGVGKEIFATAIHEQSPRALKPFVRVNCTALPETILESELFGYERGAFTGASQTKPGLIEAAHGGTFFLDEIGDMPLATQAKLLRVLECGEVMRLGALKPRAIDVRFVAATNAPVSLLLNGGTFRRDLYYRLNGLTIAVPPLRERTGEIVSLAMSFIAARTESSRRRPPALGPGALARLQNYPWPGNVRQLKNVVERALALCEGDVISSEHIV